MFHVVDGSGPPLLLLHGFPQTHVWWSAVVQRLRDDFTLVCPDLPGYGENASASEDLSKRTMANRVLTLMRELGHDRFAVAGHDRGGLVGQRLALEHPLTVSHLAILDIVPVLDMWEAVSADMALAAYHLFLLAQPPDLTERLLAAAPEAFVDSFLDGWCTTHGAITDTARAAYHHTFARPEAIHGICQDYRAGATIDLEHDRTDRISGRQITAPTLVLWQQPGGTPPPFDPLAIWQRWANNIIGHGLDAGHFLPEEAPDQVATALQELINGCSDGATGLKPGRSPLEDRPADAPRRAARARCRCRMRGVQLLLRATRRKEAAAGRIGECPSIYSPYCRAAL